MSVPSVSLSIAELAAVAEGTLHGPIDPSMQLVVERDLATVDSRNAEPGSVFFALRGARDGHQFVASAVERGAACAVVATAWADQAQDLPLIAVEDPLAALQQFAAWYRSRLSATFVAIAGTVGKTTTKDALVALLSTNEFVYGSPGSYNSQIGVPLSVLRCPPDASVAVIEVAATRPGEMAILAPVVQPNIVAIPTLFPDRFAPSFGSRDAYFDEIGAISQRTNPDIVLGRDAERPLVFRDARRVGDEPMATRIYRAGTGRFSIDVLAGPGAPARVDVLSSSTWLVHDVELAIATAAAMERPVAGMEYAPSSLDYQTWTSPAGLRIVRAAAVDDAMAWRAALHDGAADGTQPQPSVILIDEIAADFRDSTLRVATELGADTTIVTRSDKLKERLIALNPALSIVLLDDELTATDFVDTLAPTSVIKVLAGRQRLIGDLTQELIRGMAPTRLYIDLAATEHNVECLKKQIGPGADLMAVVKAGAYRTSAPDLAKHLSECGIDGFAVSHVEEGLALRQVGITEPILALLPNPIELEKAARANIEVVIFGDGVADAVRAMAEPPAVHIEVETGMNRTGLPPAVAIDLFKELHERGVPIAGVMSHLSSADDPNLDELTLGQFRTFTEVIEQLRSAGLPIPPRHILATSGVLRFPEHAYEMVRVGIGLHGIAPSDRCPTIGLVPSLALVSRITAVKDVPPGGRVGYSATFTAGAEGVRTATVPVGYDDGIGRSFGSVGQVAIDGVLCPVIGAVSMDSMTVDITDCPTAETGSDVVIFGSWGGSSLPIEQASASMGTIPYEVMTRIGPRVQKIFGRH